MEERILFEKFVFNDEKAIFINEIEFCIDRIIFLPQIRPHKLEKAVKLSEEYCQISDFRRKMLEKSIECPFLIYRLYKKGFFKFYELDPFLMRRDSFLLCYYFRKEIDDFNSIIQCKEPPNVIDKSFLENENEIDQLIEFGFYPSSVEYCLKYDFIDDFSDLNIKNQEAKWSPFEWSKKPKYLDLLSFSGYFGSVKCFKHLLMRGFEINNQVLSMVVCSGSFDLYHLCKGPGSLSSDCLCMSSEFFHLSLLAFMIENGADINGKDNSFELNCLIKLLFI